MTSSTSGYESVVKLPAPRGPLSETVVAALSGDPDGRPVPFTDADPAPYGEDLTLALHLLYELHYRGFDGVHPAWEWDPELLKFRAQAEIAFLAALRSDVDGGDDLTGALSSLMEAESPAGRP